MLRKATADDLPALTALRCGAAKANPVDAAGWLQNVAGLENILVLEKSGQPAAMLAAVPVKYGQHRGVWLCGAAGVQGVPMDRLLPKIMEGCLRAYGASGFDFAVTTPDDARRARRVRIAALAALLDPGDEVIVFAPYFVEYDGYVRNYDGKVVVISPDTETFMPKLSEFEEKITPSTKAVIINNPNNPTGVVYSEEIIRSLAAILERKEKEFGISIVLISDEPYRELAYGGVQVPFITNYYHNSVVVYSYSKSLSVPGERIGYLVIPDELEDSKELIQAATIANRVLGCVNAPSLMQKVIQYCIEHDVTVDLETYERNRDLIYSALTEYGFTCAKPDGAFYLFVKSPVEDEKEFCETAKKHHVLFVPGSSFACPGYVRIAYCVSYDQIKRSLPAFREIAKEYGLTQ